MKGVDVVGSLLEPAPQVEGTEVRSKDAKQFDTLLAQAVELESGGGKHAAVKGKLGAQQHLPGAQELAADVPKAELAVLDKSRVLELPVHPRSIHNAIQQPVASTELAANQQSLVAEPSAELDGEKLEEKDVTLAPAVDLNRPVGPEAMQQVLAQVASVVARIVAPKESSTPVSAPQVGKAGKLTTTSVEPAPAPSTPGPADSRDFAAALGALDNLPPLAEQHDVYNAVTLRPGADIGAPADLSVTGLPGAVVVASASPAVTSVAAGPSSALPPGATPPSTPPVPSSRLEQLVSAGQGAKAPVRSAAEKVINAFRSLSPLGGQTEPVVTAGVPPVTRSLDPANSTVASNTNANATGSPDLVASPPAASPPAASPLAVGPRVQPNARIVITPGSGPDMPTLRPGADATPPTAPAPTPSTGAPTAPAPTTEAQLTLDVKAAPGEPKPATKMVSAAQPANSNAVAPAATATPVLVQVEQAVSEQVQAAESEHQDKPQDEPRERVHGFERSGWAGGHAMSAYGGRGHEGSERGDRGDRGETLKHEDERDMRIGESAYIPAPVVPQPDQTQLLQANPQAQEARAPVVPQNVPAPPAAPVQELPDIVFQGRPDPTAATENASISLHHPDLGPIQLEVHREQGRVEVHAVIETQHAQAVLRANENGIRQGVQQSGMTFSALRVRVRGEEQPTSRQGQQRRRRSSERES
jgi:flagellar hook-length control protein FliK